MLTCSKPSCHGNYLCNAANEHPVEPLRYESEATFVMDFLYFSPKSHSSLKKAIGGFKEGYRLPHCFSLQGPMKSSLAIQEMWS